jgi:hypothetical protein
MGYTTDTIRSLGMIIYDGIYHWGPPDRPRHGAETGGEHAWWVRIIDFVRARPEIRFLKPHAVFATPAAPRDFLLTCAQALGQTILDEFNLLADKVLWVEHFKKDPGHLHVALFKPVSRAGSDLFYVAGWRAIRPNELQAIRPFVPEAAFIEL